MAELWYRLEDIPDLTLNKYSSLEGKGVSGVIDKHKAFLRLLNRKGIVSGVSFHLFYLYLKPEDKTKDKPGHRLRIFLLIKGPLDTLDSVKALIEASPLSDFYNFIPDAANDNKTSSIFKVVSGLGLEVPVFNTCSFLSKEEILLPAGTGEGEEYYMLRDWEMNEDGRLYNMCQMMEALKHTVMYRVDLYPVDRSSTLRESLKRPMGILRKRQDDRSSNSAKDYDGKDVLDSYEDLIEKYDSSPHFIANIMVFANSKEDSVAILDAAGAESLDKGKYAISTYSSNFPVDSFLDGNFAGLENIREGMIVKPGKPGLIVCKENTSHINLNYLPTLFTLEEIETFFRFPALYDGENIQIPKETAPAAVNKRGALYIGKDGNGYDVYFPISLLPKHAFVAGVPGSGKTNTMHHLTSSLWKEHKIPFLVLEPAKSEYRALLNDPGMKGVYLFSPNADMSFPLHINPFEMPKGTMVSEHIRRLCAVFEGAFPLEPPMPFLLDTAIEAVYRELGWIPEHVYMGDEEPEVEGKKRRLPTMSMLYRRLEQELKSTQYSSEIRGNLESALKVRIGSLLRREMGDVFDVPTSTFPPEKWLEIPAIIELESMGTGPANFLTLMLCSLIRSTLKVDPLRERSRVKGVERGGFYSFEISKPELFDEVEVFKVEASRLKNTDINELTFSSASGKSKLIFEDQELFTFEFDGMKLPGYYSLNKDEHSLSLYWGNKDTRHVIFIEEAHNLIGPESEEQTGADANPKIAATAFVVKMLAEVRALKEAIFIADQLPTVMAQEVLKNTGLKLGLRITSQDDRGVLGGTMAASPLQLDQMATFQIGESLIFYEKLKKPFVMRIHEWWGEIEDSQKKEEMVTSKNDKDLRRELTSNRAYRDANIKSIDIIRQKYLMLYKDNENMANDIRMFLDAAYRLKGNIEEINRFLEEAESSGKELDEAIRNKKKDRQKELNEERDSFVRGSEKEIKDVIDFVKMLSDWVYTIERLKNGRWKRFDSPPREIARISAVQAAIAADMQDIYKYMFIALGDVKEVMELAKELQDILSLSTTIYKEIATYTLANGVDSIK